MPTRKLKAPPSLKPLFDYLDTNIVTKAEFNDLRSDIKHLPTIDEFYTKMDEVMGELKAIREEQAVTGQILRNHEDRIVVVEDKLTITSN